MAGYFDCHLTVATRERRAMRQTERQTVYGDVSVTSFKPKKSPLLALDRPAETEDDA